MIPLHRGVLAAIHVLVLFAFAAAGASASERAERSFHPTPGVVTPPPADAQPLRDRVLEKSRLDRPARAVEAAYPTPDGMTVYVTASDYYLPDPAADQELVNFIAGLLHGPELNGLRVYVAGPPELPGLCGAEVAACYVPAANQMFIVGEPSYGGLPTDYVTAHEYGHHVQNHRVNPPFGGGALEWGTKRWATYIGACPGVVSGRLDRGNYYQHPGEAHAESYAVYHFPGLIPWNEWDAFFAPDETALRLLAEDVTNPWTKPRKVKYKGRNSGSFTLKTPLDGTVKLVLKGPRKADFDLYVFHKGRKVAQSTGPKARETVKYLVCGEAKLRVVIKAVKGSGRGVVKVSVP